MQEYRAVLVNMKKQLWKREVKSQPNQLLVFSLNMVEVKSLDQKGAKPWWGLKVLVKIWNDNWETERSQRRKCKKGAHGCTTA